MINNNNICAPAEVDIRDKREMLFLLRLRSRGEFSALSSSRDARKLSAELVSFVLLFPVEVRSGCVGESSAAHTVTAIAEDDL